MKAKELFVLCRDAVSAWIDDYAPSMGAAISYYTIFSLSPLLIIVIAIAGAVFGREVAQQQIVAQISQMVGENGAAAVAALLKSADESDKGLIAGLISVVVLLVGATTVFAELQSSLDRIWHVPEKDKPSGVWAVLRARLLSFGLILGLAFLLIVSLVVSAGLAAFGSWFGGLMPGEEVLLQVLNLAVSLVIMTILFAMIYKLMPSAKIRWRDVWIGAGVTAVLFEIGKLGIAFYLGKSGFSESFAAAGSLVILVAWVYYATQIFLLGAEFTKVYASAHGSHVGNKAQQATEVAAQIKEHGVLPVAAAVQGAATAPAHDRPDSSAELARTAKSYKDAEKKLAVAKVALSRQLVVLAVVTLADAAARKWMRKRRSKRAVVDLAEKTARQAVET